MTDPGDDHPQVQQMQLGSPEKKRLRKALVKCRNFSEASRPEREAHRLAELIKGMHKQQIQEV